MSAWTLAWVDRNIWAAKASKDPTALEALGQILGDHEDADTVEATIDGFGRLRNGDHPVAFLQSVPPRLIMWGGGDLDLYHAESEEVAAFLATRTSLSDDSILIVAVDYDEANRRPPLQVGDALGKLLAGAQTADLGHTSGGARVCYRVGWSDTVTFGWHRNALTRTDELTASERHEILEALQRRRIAKRPEVRPTLAALAVARNNGWVPLPAEPTSLTVLLGRNGAGKTMILEDIALALARLAGEQDVDRLRTSFPSLARRDAEAVEVDARATFHLNTQLDAEELFRDVFFLLAYSPVGSSGLCAAMPSGKEVWDALTPVESADALDPRQLAAQFDLDPLRAAMVDAMLASVSCAHDHELLRRIFVAYLSSPRLTLDADESVGYRPPCASGVAELAGQVTVPEFMQLINEETRGCAQDAAFWALSAIRPDVGSAVSGLSTPHPRLGALYAGWERSPWTELHNDVVVRLKRALPRVVLFDPAPGATGVEHLVEELVLGLVGRVIRAEDIQSGGHAHPFASDPVRAVATRMAGLLAERATSILPGFAVALGDIDIQIANSTEWHRRRLRVMLRTESGATPVAATPSGVLSWCCASLRFAAAQLIVAQWSGGSLSARSTALIAPDQLAPKNDGLDPVLYLADEPEAHLHPTAIREVVDICHQLARSSAGGVVVATHALEFLGRPDMVITPYLVSEGIPERCPAGLPSLRERANELGISAAMVLMSARAVLCVEGPTDDWAVMHFTDGELDRAFVHTLRLFGMEELAERLPELDLVFSLDIPVYILLDHVRASKLRELVAGRGVTDATKEERELARLAQSLRGRSATVLPMAKVDIVRTIPDAAMQVAADELGVSSWPGWRTVGAAIDHLWEKKRTPFKDAFHQVVGARVDQVVSTLKRRDRSELGFTSPELMRITHALVADLSSGAYRTATEGLRVLPA